MHCSRQHDAAEASLTVPARWLKKMPGRRAMKKARLWVPRYLLCWSFFFFFFFLSCGNPEPGSVAAARTSFVVQSSASNICVITIQQASGKSNASYRDTTKTADPRQRQIQFFGFCDVCGAAPAGAIWQKVGDMKMPGSTSTKITVGTSQGPLGARENNLLSQLVHGSRQRGCTARS